MGFWSKVSNILSGAEGRGPDVSLSNYLNPEGVGFQQNIAPQIDTALRELSVRDADTMIVKSDGTELQKLGTHSPDLGRQGDHLMGVAAEMDKKGQAAFAKLDAKFGVANVQARANSI